MSRKILTLGLAGAVCLVAGYFAYAANSLSTAVLTTDTGKHEIAVEVADTPETRATGLMNRPSMPEDHGMLFDFDENRDVTMWMKNTLIPLDMLFIDETGKVTRVSTNAQPLSLATIPSGGPVRYVLEINGGAAARYGVKAGDRLAHPIIPAAN
ncbi:DUF192 domain-containing protein [Antarcticirhabdus aurantiaca]|uniref:DUF192 domain-containing protein n=1 Tax=Antarcticirhabdus aurantiaca TaxID=2606717 RepID=A0ACD4NV20_9HYPH|nr:DUF192 domain-containing protein [Antarcticirhabdus aurantiaca]WAJ30742.1 DUF192 domain-containing protein [Jeongeuplla avenae]